MLPFTHTPSPTQAPIADALVIVSSDRCSLADNLSAGITERESRWQTPTLAHFRLGLVVSWGDERDIPIAASLAPTHWSGTVSCVSNMGNQESARFLAHMPERALDAMTRANSGTPPRSVVVYAEQHDAGVAAIALTRHLRAAGITTALVARGGYPWSWFAARNSGPASREALQAGLLEGELCHAADLIVGTTQTMLDDLAWHHALDPERLRLVPNFVLADQPATPLHQRDQGLVLCAGRFHTQKRFDLALRAFAESCRSLRSAGFMQSPRLLLVGSGPDERPLRALAKSLNVSIEFRPRIAHHELLALMHRCRVFLQTSAFEGHPKTVLEALAAGAPTVVTDAPGLRETIEHEVTGLVARSTHECIARDLTRLLSDDALATRLSHTASERIRGVDGLTLELFLPRIERVLREAMTRASALSERGPTQPLSTPPLSTPPVLPNMVRWEPQLLTSAPAPASRAFAMSILAYADRLAPELRRAFLEELSARLEAPATAPGPASASVDRPGQTSPRSEAAPRASANA